jgi:hypothetical protein
MVDFDLISSTKPDYAKIAGEYGWLCGCRLGDVGHFENHEMDIEFIDMDWNNPNPAKLITACERHRPRYAVAGDYDADESNYHRVNTTAKAIRQYVEHPIVVPHESEDMDYIPRWATVGYSTPTGYNSADIDYSEFAGEDVHILGGSPLNQFEAVKEMRSEVVSVDGNYIFKLVNKYAAYWSEPKYQRQRLSDFMRLGDAVPEANDDFLEVLWRLSVENLANAFERRFGQ